MLQRLLGQLGPGDPRNPRAQQTGTVLTLNLALEAHFAEKPHRPRTIEGYRYHLANYMSDMRTLPVSQITRQMLRERYAYLKINHGETTAASTMRTVKAIINTALRVDETLTANPAAALYIPSPKRRKVAPLDLGLWWKRVHELPPIRRDLHITMMLTGARRTSILLLRRADVDIENEILTLTHMKTSDEPLTLPIGPFLTRVLKARLEEDKDLDSPWLWPSPNSESGRIVEPRARGLPGPHQYRHHARTYYIGAGVPYAQSALLLGHKLPGATGAYVHLAHLVEDLREHTRTLENYVFERIRKAKTQKETRKPQSEIDPT